MTLSFQEFKLLELNSRYKRFQEFSGSELKEFAENVVQALKAEDIKLPMLAALLKNKNSPDSALKNVLKQALNKLGAPVPTEIEKPKDEPIPRAQADWQLIKKAPFVEVKALQPQPEDKTKFLEQFYQQEIADIDFTDPLKNFAQVQTQVDKICNKMLEYGFSNFPQLTNKFSSSNFSLLSEGVKKQAVLSNCRQIKEYMESILFLIENSPPEKRNDIAKNFKDRQFACGDGTLENLTVIYSEMSLGKQNFDAYLSKQKRLMTEAFIMPLFQKGLFKTIGIWQSQRTEIHHISSLVNAVADEFGLVKKTTVEDRYIKNTSRFQEVISTEVNKGFSTPEALTSLIDGVAEKIRSNLENQVDFSDPAFKDQVQSFIGGLDLPTSYNYNHLIDIENKCFKANLTDILRDIVGVTLDEKRILDIPNLEITKQRLAIEGSIDDKFKQRVSKDVLGDNPTEGTWKYILENGLKLNEKDFGTENPFEYCASQGIMIDGQSPINYFIKNDRPIRGFNPIVYAIEHLDFTAHSIDKAIDKKSLNKALFDTRNSGTFLILQELGADINSLNYKAQTLLSNAAEKGHKDILELLLSEKENNKVIFKVDNHGKTAFHYAAESNNNNLIEILAKNDPSNRGLLILDKKQDSPLHIAINMGRKENVETILSKDKKGKILFQNHNSLFGTSPLNLAIRKGDKEIINTLLSHGASPSLNTLIKSLIFSTKLSPDIKKSLCTSYINSWKPSKKTVDATVKVDTKIKTNSIKNSTQPTKER